MPYANQPDSSIKAIWNRIDGNVKVAFFVSFITGLLVHAFILVNRFSNHDDLGAIYYSEAQVIWDLRHGRWFIPFPSAISSLFSMPWVNGFLGIVYISVAVCFVVSCFKINQKTTCVLVACLFVTFPTVFMTMLFTWMADVNFLSLMLACFAAYLASRFKYGFLPAIVPLTLSMGIYQAYFGVAAGLLVLILIIEVLRNQVSWQSTFFNGLRFVVLLGASMAMYLVIVRLTTPPEGLVSLQNINEMGKITVSEIPDMLSNAYFKLIAFYLFDELSLHQSILDYLLRISFFACGVLLALWTYRQRLYKNPIKFVLLLVLLVLFPLGCNIVYMFGAMNVHGLMIFGMVLVPVLMLIIMDLFMNGKETCAPSGQTGAATITVNLSCWVIIATVAFSIFNYFIISNIVYLRQHYAYEKGYAQYTTLVSRIQSLDGYQTDMTICLVGCPKIDTGTPELNSIHVTGSSSDYFGINPSSFLRTHLNITQPVQQLERGVVDIDDENVFEIVKQMPQYPNHGSVDIIGNEIYVKFSD